MVVPCKYRISLGWVDIAVEFDLMSVNQSNCNTEYSFWRYVVKPRIGYHSEEVFSFVKSVIKPDGGVV